VDGADWEEDRRYWIRIGVLRDGIGIPGYEDGGIESAWVVIYHQYLIVYSSRIRELLRVK